MPMLASNITSLAMLHSDSEAFSNSIVLYEEALDMYNKLNTVFEHVYDSDLARVYTNMAEIDAKNSDHISALKKYEKVLSIRKALSQEGVPSTQADVASILNNIAIVHKVLKNFEIAKKAYVDAINILNRLLNFSSDNHDLYMPKIAMFKTNLGNLHVEDNELFSAEKEFLEAYVIRKQLASQSPKVYQPKLAITTNSLSVFYLQNIKDEGKSLKFAKETIQNAYPYIQALAMANQLIESACSVIVAWGKNPNDLFRE